MSFSKGDKVHSRRDPDRIGIVEALGPRHSGIQYYRVFFGGAAGTRTVAELDLLPVEAAPTSSQRLIAGNLSGYQVFQRRMTYQRLVRESPLKNNVYAFNASRTRFYPYQFKPLIKLLDSPRHRLLICDEVGLGKTIEAGLILTELRARQTMRTVLVVCPSNLTSKWRLELRQRFGEEFGVLGVDDFLEFLDDYDSRPDRVSLSGIVSLESLRGDRALERLEATMPAFDLVVIDEAHHMRNFGRKQRKVGELLSRSASAMVMLTATPVHLGSQNLFSLLNILDEDDFPDQSTADQRFKENEPIVRAQALLARTPVKLVEVIQCLERAAISPWVKSNPLHNKVLAGLRALTAATPVEDSRGVLLALQKDVADLNLLSHIFTRTRKRQVHTEVPVRKAVAIELSFSPVEREFYEAVTALVWEQSKALGHLPIIQQWRVNMPQRRMASSLPAMVEHYRGQAMWQDVEELDDSEPSLEEKTEPTNLEAAEARLRRLLARWPTFPMDTKYDRFVSMLQELRVTEGRLKVIVFATFVGTLEYLARRLSQDGFGVRTISGGVPPDERPRLIEQFRSNPAIHVFLSSRVGSEGLDFQFCDTVFNYDLPWNPMEVEQRIGRVDRIGQESAVIRIYNFWIKDTIEERILRRLYERIGIFERSIGDLETILGDVMRELERDILSRQLSASEQLARADQVAEALERTLQDAETLESNAAQFIGTDMYFEEEIEAIRKKRRYVTGEQLRRFLEDFLRNHAERSRLEYDRLAQTGRLVADDRLREFMRRSGRAHELLGLLSAGGQGVPLTFDSQVAFRHQQLEFVNILHPLIAAIAEEYGRSEAVTATAHHIALRTDKLSQGFYFFFVYRLRVHGARGGNTLETVLLDQNLRDICDASQGETILGEMIEAGEEPPGAGLEYNSSVAERAYAAGLATFLSRIERIRDEAKRNNDVFVDRRLASLRTSYGKNIQRQKDLLTRAESAGRQDRYMNMLKGSIVRLEGELAHKVSELEALRAVEVDHEEVVAGILQVLQ